MRGLLCCPSVICREPQRSIAGSMRAPARHFHQRRAPLTPAVATLSCFLTLAPETTAPSFPGSVIAGALCDYGNTELCLGIGTFRGMQCRQASSALASVLTVAGRPANHSSTERYLDDGHSSAVRNRWLGAWTCRISCGYTLSFFWDKCPQRPVAGVYGRRMVSFMRNYQRFSGVVCHFTSLQTIFVCRCSLKGFKASRPLSWGIYPQGQLKIWKTKQNKYIFLNI